MYLIVCNMNNIPSISLRRIHLEVEKIWLSVWLGRSLSSCGELRRDRLKYSTLGFSLNSTRDMTIRGAIQ